MFKDFRRLSRKLQVRIVVAMLIMVLPVTFYAFRASVRMHENKMATSSKYDTRIEIDEATWNNLTIPADSVPVTTGMYVESITDVSVASNSWKTKFLVWFRWNDKDDPSGHFADPNDYPGNRFIVGNGSIGSKTLMIEEHNEQTGDHYQQYSVSATIEKYFDTTRYPLDSHQLKVFIEDERDISQVHYVNDDYHSAASPYLTVAGFDVINIDNGLYLNEYSSKMNDPTYEHLDFDVRGKKTIEYVFVTRVQRAGPGLFLKAFLSLLGMLLWVCIGLFNSAYNRVDAMGAMNTGIFGAVSSMIVGMNLLSDARGSGLIEYINFFSLGMILVATIYVIYLNRNRARGEDTNFTDCFAKALFWCFTIVVVGTIVSLILSASR